ncbi:hypothetical protein [Halobacteriovorax sp.]|uniref:hypothetical protein n=1 Tax=Halobacteriovorax sp. TaxID=2020862 RepID=UPI0035626A78
MNKSIKAILLSVFTVLITSCGPQRSESTTEAKVFLGALTGFNNPVMLYGGNTDANEAFARKILPSDDGIDLELAQGNWKFYALHWDGALPFEGNLSCYSSVKSIEGETMDINVTLSQTACNNTNFFPTSLGSQNPTVFNGCSNLDDVTSFSSTCTAMSKGIGKSYQIIYPQWPLSSIEEINNNASPSLISNCINPATASSIKLPIGNNESFFSPIVLSYDTSDCSGLPRDNKSLRTYKKGTNLETKEYSDGSNNFIFFTDRSSESLSVVSTSLGDSCDETFNMTVLGDKTLIVNSDSSLNTTVYQFDEETFIDTMLTPSNNQTWDLHKLGNQVLFKSYDSNNGAELWASDGTIPGTFMLKDINPGSVSSSPYNFIDYNGKVYFLATTASEGVEIWTTDGTEAGTNLVFDLNPGPNSSVSIPNFQILGNELYFAANDGTVGNELFKMDTSETITLVEDIYAGSLSSNIARLFFHNNKIYFVADDGINGNELHSYDGTTRTLLTNFSNATLYINSIEILSDQLVFTANADNSTTYGEEIYRHDGVTPNSETLISDIRAGADSSFPSFQTKTKSGELIYRATNGSIYELYKVDSSFGISSISAGNDITHEDSIIYKDVHYMLLNFNSTTTALYKYDESSNSLFEIQGACPSSCTSYPLAKFGVSAKDQLYIKKTYYDGTDWIRNIFKMGI